MKNTIIIDGIEYHNQKKLEPKTKEDFFVATGEVKFGGMYQETGFIDESAHCQNEKLRGKAHKCENNKGYYCKLKNCNFPSCIKDK